MNAKQRYKEKVRKFIRDNPDDPRAIELLRKRREYQNKWYAEHPDARRRHNRNRKPKSAASKEKLRLLKARRRREAGVPIKKLLTPEQRKQYQITWREQNREHTNSYRREKRKTDISFKIAGNLRHRLSFLVRKSCTSKTSQTLVLLGCPLPSFMIYIESLFEVGMSWENYGEWELDHIIPCALFDLTNPDHQKRCFHCSNLQPMWKAENRKKSDKLMTALQ